MGAPSEKLVIVNADDFGFSAGITEGILRAHREGIVTSTTITANMPYAIHAVERLRDAPGLGVGVHLNVAQGPVLSKKGAPLAGKDGIMRWTPLRLIQAYLLYPQLLAAIEGECEAQIRWTLDHGIRPTHLDSHRHLHAFSPIFMRVVKLAKRYDIPFIRWPYEALSGSGWPAAGLGVRCLGWWMNRFCDLNEQIVESVRATSGTWGIIHTGKIDADWLARAAQRVPAGITEIMTHPGLADDMDRKITRLRMSRRLEMEALCEARVKQAFTDNGVERIHYGNLR